MTQSIDAELASLTPEQEAALLAEDDAMAALAREDFAVFMGYVFGVEPAPFHREWYAAMLHEKRLVILSARCHGKTTSIVGFVLWSIGRNTDLRVKIVAASDGMAIERLFQIRDIMERSASLRNVFPGLKPANVGEWTKHRVVVERKRFSKDASIEAIGITSTATGGRADLIVYDDVVEMRNALQMPQLREQIKHAFKAVWSNILEPSGQAIWICTLWHQLDCSHDLIKNPEWKVLRYDVGSPTDQFAPLWPAKWPREALIQRHAEIKQREYDRAFRNIALSDDEALVPRAIMERCLRPDLKVADANPEWPRYTGVDLAIGQTNSACFTVVFTIAVDDHGRRWVVDVRRGRFTSPETARIVIDVNNQHKPNVIMVENNGMQEAVAQWIREVGGEGVPLKSFTTGSNKKALDVGLPSLRVEFENDAWICPRGDMEHGQDCECATCVWVEEVTTYPIGKFSDVLMSSWFAREAARLGGCPAASASLDVPRGRDAVLGHTRTGENPAGGVVTGGAVAGAVFDPATGRAVPAGSITPVVPAPAPGALGLLGMPRAGGLFGAGMGAGGGLTLGAASIMGPAGVGGPGMFRRRSSVFERANADMMAPVRMDERAGEGARLLADHGLVALAHVAPADWPATREKLMAEAKRLLEKGDAAAAQAALGVVAAGNAKFGG